MPFAILEAGTGDEDMEIEEGEALPSPPNAPPPPPPPEGAELGPARPPANQDFSSAYADPAAYEAYVQQNVAYQVCSLKFGFRSRVHLSSKKVALDEGFGWCPRSARTMLNAKVEFCRKIARIYVVKQELLSATADMQASTDPEYQALLAKQSELQGGGMPAGAAALSQQQKEAGLASVFKRNDEDLARRQAVVAHHTLSACRHIVQVPMISRLPWAMPLRKSGMQSDVAHRREVDEREKDPAFVSDAYAECYPGYHEYNATVVDSDDEADFSHMDSKQGGKSRVDFGTEEQWQASSLAEPC
jgi:hypothetical protein